MILARFMAECVGKKVDIVLYDGQTFENVSMRKFDGPYLHVGTEEETKRVLHFDDVQYYTLSNEGER